MRYSTAVLFLFLSLGTGSITLADSNSSLDQHYLAHWFSIDTSHPVDVTLTPSQGHNEAVGGNSSEITFINDEGMMVNGIIAYPKAENAAGQNRPKLALLLHPMGVDQQFWWSEESPLGADALTAKLLSLGYTVASLDARAHGQRYIDGFTPKQLIKKARSKAPRVYIDTIIGSVRDYRSLLHWMRESLQPSEILVAGYSMGAQMSLLLASYEPSVSAVLAMVPPYVTSPTSPVAPRVHVNRIDHAEVLCLAGKQDPYSTEQQTVETFNSIQSTSKKIVWFDAGHRLPPEFLESANAFFTSLQSQER